MKQWGVVSGGQTSPACPGGQAARQSGVRPNKAHGPPRGSGGPLQRPVAYKRATIRV
jgi:hypothetical protein